MGGKWPQPQRQARRLLTLMQQEAVTVLNVYPAEYMTSHIENLLTPLVGHFDCVLFFWRT